ncbi:MAG TPA: hypothetical protein PKH77_09565 [Anaerolineae bacterium]|nr:hypothetical protein [Anaerolineae bacterium]
MDTIAIARQQIAVGDLAGARRALVARLREDSEDLEAWLLLASVLLDPSQQAECYRRVLRLEPHHIQARALLSELTRRQPVIAQAASRRPASPTPPALPDNIPSPFAEGSFEEDEAAIEDEPDLPGEFLSDLAVTEPSNAEPLDAQELALRAWVVQELSQNTGKNVIIHELCERAGMDWPHAEKLVLSVAQQERHTIAKRQAPLLILLSIGTLVGGIVVLVFLRRPEGLLMLLGGLMGFLGVWYSLRKK